MLILVPILGLAGLVVALAMASAAGSEHLSAVYVAMVCGLIVAMLARAIPTKEDRSWLPTMIMAGFTVKLLASWLRWWVLVDYYQGSGDATGYHGRAVTELVHMWRDFSPPDMSLGTEAMRGVTGLVYFPYVPNFLGGFFMFATLAFFGQLFLYAAFRTSVTPRRLKLYAAAIFFVPNVVYWPSSIGKESVMMLGIGMAAYGVAKLLSRGKAWSLLVIAGGLVIAGVIRPHVAAMVTLGATLALLLAKKGIGIGALPARRLLLLGFVGAGLAVLILVAASNFNIDLDDGLNTAEVDGFIENVEGQTGQGGSSVDGGFISNPVQFPEVALRVLFRPLPHEAHNPPALASSLESAVLLLLVLWKLPAILRGAFHIRRDPYMIFCLMFTIVFVTAFSAFLNLGLMARERSMVMPFVLAMIVALGWGPPEPDEEDEQMDTVEPTAPGIEDLLVDKSLQSPVASRQP